MKKDTAKKTAEAVADQVKTVVDKAQEETGKLMDSLVKESEKLREQTLKLAGDAAGEVKGRVDEVRSMVESAKTKAGDTLDNLEQLFEERVGRALKRLGVPTRDDVQGIAQRLDEINDRIKTLTSAPPVAALPAPVVESAPAPALATLEKDDLKLISGIGPALEGKLNTAGISSYRQLATLSAAEIDRVESEVIHFSGRISRDEWVNQARALYAKKYGAPVGGK
ncbi:MAG: phasin family protein [Candidatus Contendobacter sp.]|jgi:poly(hydroxyalkanoate) granule-associated protein|nr:phasin family protein [Gammaproteobacteria bacterium]MCC8992258.1 phasin family protein [Candidatus Contendobacter sp.]